MVIAFCKIASKRFLQTKVWHFLCYCSKGMEMDRGGRVTISRWSSYWSMGGRVHASRSTLGSTAMMVMVPRGRCWWWLTTYVFQGHPPLPPPARLCVVVRFAITDLHSSDFFTSTNPRCPIFLSLSLFFFFPSILNHPPDFSLRFFYSRTSFMTSLSR